MADPFGRGEVRVLADRPKELLMVLLPLPLLLLLVCLPWLVVVSCLVVQLMLHLLLLLSSHMILTGCGCWQILSGS